jgi:uncharacterized protein (TIGR03435 family)
MCRLLRSGFLSAIGVASAIVALDGQVTRQREQTVIAFDVASVKPNTSGSATSTIGFRQDGRLFLAVNMSLSRVIAEAYVLAPSAARPQIVGAPRWIDAERFDIEAVAIGNPSSEQRQAMLRALLAERFKLALHREVRQLPAYDLVKSSSGKLGDKLLVSEIDCDALQKAGKTPAAAGPGELRPCVTAFGTGSLRGKGMTISQIAAGGLARILNRPVFDRTGLGATAYDWTLEWTPDQSSDTPAAAADLGLPSSIFSAVEEQLGLKLESTKSPVEVLVIDHVEKPTPD